MNPDANVSYPSSSSVNDASIGETSREDPKSNGKGGNWKQQKKKSHRKSKDPQDNASRNQSTSSDAKVPQSPRSVTSPRDNAECSEEYSSLPEDPSPEDFEKMREEWSQICKKLRSAQEELRVERASRMEAENAFKQLGTEKLETEKELQENTAQAVKLATQLALAQEDKELERDAQRRALSQDKFSPSRRSSEPQSPEVTALRKEIVRLETREKAWKSERRELEEEIQKHKLKSSELSTLLAAASREPSPRRNKNSKRTPEEKLQDSERMLSKIRAELDFSLLEKEHMQEEHDEIVAKLEADRDKLLLELSKQHEPTFIPDKVTVATQIEGDLIGPTFTLFEVVSERGVAYRRTHGNLKDRVIDMLGPTFGESVAAQEIRGDWIYTIDGFWLPTVVDGLQALVPLRSTGDKLDKSMGDKLHSIWSRYNANRNESK